MTKKFNEFISICKKYIDNHQDQDYDNNASTTENSSVPAVDPNERYDTAMERIEYATKMYKNVRERHGINNPLNDEVSLIKEKLQEYLASAVGNFIDEQINPLVNAPEVINDKNECEKISNNLSDGLFKIYDHVNNNCDVSKKITRIVNNRLEAFFTNYHDTENKIMINEVQFTLFSAFMKYSKHSLSDKSLIPVLARLIQNTIAREILLHKDQDEYDDACDIARKIYDRTSFLFGYLREEYYLKMDILHEILIKVTNNNVKEHIDILKDYCRTANREANSDIDFDFVDICNDEVDNWLIDADVTGLDNLKNYLKNIENFIEMVISIKTIRGVNMPLCLPILLGDIENLIKLSRKQYKEEIHAEVYNGFSRAYKIAVKNTDKKVLCKFFLNLLDFVYTEGSNEIVEDIMLLKFILYNNMKYVKKHHAESLNEVGFELYTEKMNKLKEEVGKIKIYNAVRGDSMDPILYRRTIAKWLLLSYIKKDEDCNKKVVIDKKTEVYLNSDIKKFLQDNSVFSKEYPDAKNNVLISYLDNGQRGFSQYGDKFFKNFQDEKLFRYIVASGTSEEELNPQQIIKEVNGRLAEKSEFDTAFITVCTHGSHKYDNKLITNVIANFPDNAAKFKIFLIDSCYSGKYHQDKYLKTLPNNSALLTLTNHNKQETSAIFEYQKFADLEEPLLENAILLASKYTESTPSISIKIDNDISTMSAKDFLSSYDSGSFDDNLNKFISNKSKKDRDDKDSIISDQDNRDEIDSLIDDHVYTDFSDDENKDQKSCDEPNSPKSMSQFKYNTRQAAKETRDITASTSVTDVKAIEICRDTEAPNIESIKKSNSIRCRKRDYKFNKKKKEDKQLNRF